MQHSQIASSVQSICFPEFRQNPVLLPESFRSCTFGDALTVKLPHALPDSSTGYYVFICD
jgi:hypothetical protein